jgi:hypothetical protein
MPQVVMITTWRHMQYFSQAYTSSMDLWNEKCWIGWIATTSGHAWMNADHLNSTDVACYVSSLCFDTFNLFNSTGTCLLSAISVRLLTESVWALQIINMTTCRIYYYSTPSYLCSFPLKRTTPEAFSYHWVSHCCISSTILAKTTSIVFHVAMWS